MSALIVAPLLLAGVLILAALAKWGDRESLVSATRALRLPGALTRVVHLLPPLEAALALGLLVLPWPAAFAGVAALVLALMLAYTVVVARGLTMSPRPSCGCFGRVGSPITPLTLVRNLVLTTLAAAALVWGVRGQAVPPALADAGRGAWRWLAATAIAAALAWVLGREYAGPAGGGRHTGSAASVGAHSPAAGVNTAAGSDPATGEPDDYVRQPIAPLFLLDEEQPVNLAELAAARAQLLIWVTCGCPRSHDTLARAQDWRESLPGVEVRMVSTLPAEFTRAVFPAWSYGWLFDPKGRAFATLGVHRDPAALLLGADGLYAGGPVAGTDEVAQFADDIAAELAAADHAQTADYAQTTDHGSSAGHPAH